MGVDPFLAIFTLYPFFSVDISVVARVDVDLVAEVAKLLVLIGITAVLAKPPKLVFPELSS